MKKEPRKRIIFLISQKDETFFCLDIESEKKERKKIAVSVEKHPTKAEKAKKIFQVQSNFAGTRKSATKC